MIWSKKNLAYLRRHYPNGTPVDIIAARVGCCMQMVYDRAKYERLSREKRHAHNAITWTRAMITFLQRNYHRMSNRELSDGLGLRLTSVRMKLYELGLKRMELEYWTDEQVAYLKDHFRSKGDQELADEFQQVWPKKKIWSKKHIEKKRKYLGLVRSIQEQFTIRTGRFNARDYSDFNGKNFPQRKRRLWHQNGKFRWMIKVGREFIPYHRYRWELFRGPIPKSKKIHFIDGDTTNCRLSNLALVSQRELAKLVSKKVHEDLNDSYIAGILSSGDPELKRHLLNRTEVIQAKRNQILYNRVAGRSKSKYANS